MTKGETAASSPAVMPVGPARAGAAGEAGEIPALHDGPWGRQIPGLLVWGLPARQIPALPGLVLLVLA